MVFVAIDIETGVKEKDKYKLKLDATGKYFLSGCVMLEDFSYNIFDDKQKMWEHLKWLGEKYNKQRKVVNVYAHNMKYDFWNVFDRTDTNMTWFSSSPFIGEYSGREGKTNYIDSMNLFHMSLEKMGKIIGYPKMDMEFEFHEDEFDRLITYMINDTEIVMRGLHLIKRKLNEDGLNLKRIFTIHQLGIQYFLEYYKKFESSDNFFYDKKFNKVVRVPLFDFVHNAYRGARTEAFKLGKFESVYYVDCNNLYGYSAMNMEFPDLKTSKVIYYPLNMMDLMPLLDMFGFSRCAIYNEYDEIGLLPVTINGNMYFPKKGKLMFGTFTHLELKKAIYNGYKILQIDKSVVFGSIENPYEQYIPYLYSKRKKSKNMFDDYFYKSLMNSSFGKLGQRRVNQKIQYDDISNLYERVSRKWNIMPGTRRGLGALFKKVDEKKTYKKYYCPAVPAYVNAGARCYMWDWYKKVGLNNLVYSDNDSIIATVKPDVPISECIGDFKWVKMGEEATVWGKKCKRVGDDIGMSGVHKSNLKIESFDKGFVYSNSQLGLNSGLENVGKFVEEVIDLDDVKIKHLNKMYELDNRVYYIDDSFDKVVEYLKMPIIRSLIKELGGKYV